MLSIDSGVCIQVFTNTWLYLIAITAPTFRIYYTVRINNALNIMPRDIYNPDFKMVRCAVNMDTSFAQCWNREYRTVNKVMLLNSTYIIPSRTNVNKRLAVKYS